MPVILRFSLLLSLLLLLSAPTLVHAQPVVPVVTWGEDTHTTLSVPDDLGAIVQVATGWKHSLALRSDGTVRAWGWNDHGQINVPGNLTGVAQVAAGEQHSLALLSDGTVRGWGLNTEGQLNIPSELQGVTTHLVAGQKHSLALLSDGTVRAWGRYVEGQLNIPSGLNNVVQVAAGTHHSLALLSDGTVRAWGWNNNSQSTVPDNLVGVVQIAAATNHSVALLADGTMRVWGATWHHLYHSVPDVSDVIQIIMGDDNAIALKSDGTLVEWGSPWAPVHTTMPSNLEGVTQASLSYRHVLVLVGTGQVTNIGSTGQGPGWHMLSSPMTGATVQDLANANLVYGIPGEYPNTDDINPLIGYRGDHTLTDATTVEGFVVPSGLAQPLVPGRGFMWYLWGDALEPGTRPDVTGPTNFGESSHLRMPFPLTFTGSPVVINHSVTFTTNDRVSGGGDAWYLIGNPFTGDYDVSGIIASSGTLSAAFQHHDPTEGGGDGAYVCIDKDDEECLEAAALIMGFFAEVTDAELPLTFTFAPPDNNRSTAERFTVGFELTGTLLVEYEGQQFPMPVHDRNARVVFSEEATDGRDRLDAGKLNPLGSYYWANIAMMGRQGDEWVRRSAESRPLPQSPVTIPMAFTTHAFGELHVGGAFTISLSNHALGAGWQVSLHDLETGETVDLLTDSYTFSIDVQAAIDADERFEITFTPPTVSGEGGGKALVFGLEAVWPNPTASMAQVRFALAVAGEISLEMFDMLGRRVAQVARGEFAAGPHVLPLNTSDLASGVYVVRLTAGSQTAVLRMTIAR